MKLPGRYRDALVDQVHPTGDFQGKQILTQPCLIKFPNLLFSAARVTVNFTLLTGKKRRNFSPPCNVQSTNM